MAPLHITMEQQDMQLTRQHFKFIALVIREMGHKHRSLTIEAMAKHFADSLAETNTQFNRNKFLEACNVL